MAIIASVGDGRDFEPAPEGVHQAVCVDVVDLGILKVVWQGKEKLQPKINVVWQIDEAREDGKRFLVFKRYTLSLSEKANLRKDLQAWRGRPFTADELNGFDVEKLVGANCLINVQHNPAKNGKTYANVMSIMPLAKGMPKMEPTEYVRKKDRVPAADGHDPSGDDVHLAAAEELTAEDIPF